jgi:capsular polysaccharide biosynthesis protein
MELLEYWQILRRRWMIPIVLTLAVALFSALQLRPWEARPPQFGATMRLLVGVMPATDTDAAAYDPRYYAWLTSEYLVDDFTEVVGSQLFAANVSRRLGALQASADPETTAAEDGRGLTLPAGVIQGSAVTGRQHRILTLNLTWGDAVQLAELADAAAAELVENAPTYFQQMGTDNADVTLLDAPVIYTIGPSLRERLEWPMRLGLALVVGLGIVFLLHYLDTSVRTRKDLEELGLAILGEIPKKR